MFTHSSTPKGKKEKETEKKEQIEKEEKRK